MSFFTISPAQPALVLDGRTRRGSLTFDVQNKSGHPRDLRALVVAGEGESAPQLSVAEPVRPARVDETVQFSVDVEAPAGLAPGTYTFRLRVVAEDDPDDVFGESDPVGVAVPEPVKPATPWWIYAAGAAAVVAVVAVVGFLLFFSGGGGGEGPRVLSIAPEAGRSFVAETFDGSSFVAPVPLAAVVEDDDTPVAELVVEWASEESGVLGSDLLLEPSLPGACRGLRHDITLTVTDGDGNETTEETTVTVSSPLFAPGIACPLILDPRFNDVFSQAVSQAAVERLRVEAPDLFRTLTDQRLIGILEAQVASGATADEALREAYRAVPEAVAQQAELLDADLGTALRSRMDANVDIDAVLAEFDDEIEDAGGVNSLRSQ